MKSFLTIFFLSWFFHSSAQVVFEPISFIEALDKSERDGKYLMVVLDSKDCDYCNEVADKSFINQDLGKKLAAKFISIRPKIESGDWTLLSQRFDVPAGMATLFFSGNGVLLYRHNGTTSMAKHYADAAETALGKETEILNLKSLEEAYRTEKNNAKVLQALLLKRKELWLATDLLLDEYVKLLPQDSLHSLHQLQFIATFAPVLDSYADDRLRENPDLFNQAWYRMDLPARIRLNNQIIFKTRQLAISERDELIALRVANFAASTNNNPSAKQRGYLLNMMEYFKGVHDTTRYLSTAMNYYNGFLMTISVDSILRKDSLEKQRLFATANPDTVRDPASMNVTNIKKTVEFRPTAQIYMKELNKAAWNFYNMTRDPKYIALALQWSTRALEFYKAPDALDTHARLLYITGKKEEAIRFETEAITLLKKSGYNTRDYETALYNMQQGKEKLD